MVTAGTTAALRILFLQLFRITPLLAWLPPVCAVHKAATLLRGPRLPRALPLGATPRTARPILCPSI